MIYTPTALGGPPIAGQLKQTPEDFQVTEQLGFDLSGAGEHLYCWVEKTGLDTSRCARLLAGHADVPSKQVSFAGMKDKQAITKQWFSIHLPGKQDINWDAFNTQNLRVLESVRHHKKLQRGNLKGNKFQLHIRAITGDLDKLASLFEKLSVGFPNYFGLQRFGVDGQNIEQAKAFLLEGQKVKGRQLKGILYSATRSLLFNKQLANRIKQNTWNQILSDDAVCLQGSNSFFIAEESELENLSERLQQQDVAPAGLLWGRNNSDRLQHVSEQVYQQLAEDNALMDALVAHKLDMGVRPLITYPQQLEWSIDGNNLVLSFFLPKGCYATALLNEVLSQ